MQQAFSSVKNIESLANPARSQTMNKKQLGIETIPQEQNLANKEFAAEALNAIANASASSVRRKIEACYAKDAQWRGSHPINEVSGPADIAEAAWKPLLRAFPDLERRDDILVGGRFRGRDYVAMTGHYLGTFKKPWLDIPATGQAVFIRYGEVHQIEDGRIVQSNCLWDILDVIRQAGFWPLAPSWGMEGMWPGPITNDGIVMTAQDPAEGEASILQTLAMHQTLGDYNDHEMAGREGLINMPQKEHWHKKMMWYGPSGIGTNRGLEGFVDFHQLPFRLIWPNRKGGGQKSKNKNHGHYIRIGDGHFSVTGGWPSVVAQHTGKAELFGTGPTGRTIEMRVMDFYNHHEGKIRENWVPIDIIHVLLQMNIDIMARVKDQFGPKRLGLR